MRPSPELAGTRSTPPGLRPGGEQMGVDDRVWF